MFGFFKRVFGRSEAGYKSSPMFLKLVRPLFWLTHCDAFRHADALIGVLILGCTGSGKSSGSGKTIRDSYLSNDYFEHQGYGFLVLTAKISETSNWIDAAHNNNRDDDLIIVNEANQWRCNLIAYLLDSGESVEQVVKRIVQAVKSSSGSLQQSSGGAADYFDKAFEQLLVNGLTILSFVGEDVTFSNLYRLIRSAPINQDKINFIRSFKTLDQAVNSPPEKLSKITFFDSCAIIANEKIEKETGNLAAEDVKEALYYFFNDYAAMPDNQRQAVYATFTANIDPLARGIYNRLFSGKTNFTPEDSRNGKIIILDVPVNKYDYVGKFAQNFFKDIWLSSLMKQAPKPDTRIVSLWIDEYQNFIERGDMIAFSQSREYLIAPVCITQNLPALFERTNDKQSLAKGITGSLVNKFFHANNDHDTNEWASEMVGYEMQEQVSYSVGSSQKDRDFVDDMMFESTDSNISANISSTRACKIEPNRFLRLAKGGHDHDLKVEAIHISTREFKATDENYLLIEFDQRN